MAGSMPATWVTPFSVIATLPVGISIPATISPETLVVAAP